MSRLTDLISQVKAKDPELGKELDREFKTLSERVPFGLNFERHSPENVELPGRPIRKGDKVRILPPRGSTKKSDRRLWRVTGFSNYGGERFAKVELIRTDESEEQQVPVNDLVVAAEFRDYIYPGLVSTRKVERGGDKPFQARGNSIAWYRNPGRSTQESLGIIYEFGNELSTLRPDFIFFGENSNGEIVADIVDPHSFHLADALPKLKGLVGYAERHSSKFRRIEAIAMLNNEYKLLDLKERSVRTAVLEASTAKSLYDSPFAQSYDVAS